MRFLSMVLMIFLLTASSAMAKEGIVSDTGDTVLVEDSTIFNEGDTIPVFDADGTQHDLQVISVTDTEESTSVEFIDAETGDAKTIEFLK